MPYFPLFVDLTNKRVLVVGAGEVAARKIEKLIPFAPQIEIIAPRADDAVLLMIEMHGLDYKKRGYERPDLEGRDYVIVAADDIELQKQIFADCQKMKTPCNCVDSPLYCSFTFPSLIMRGDLVLGISSAGRAPGLIALVRSWLDEQLPRQLDDVLVQVERFREFNLKDGSSLAQRAARVRGFASELMRSLGMSVDPAETSSSPEREKPRPPQS